MHDAPLEFRRGNAVISTDRTRLDPDAILQLLHNTFWAGNMSEEVLRRAMANSISFGVFDGPTLVGFGRVVSDLATYAYWTDVVIAPSHRGRGLGRWLSECMLAHPDLQNLRRVALLTHDAVSLYARVGFTSGPGELVYMEHRQ
jgi:GNAT superfamily N-acetyltransferase